MKYRVHRLIIASCLIVSGCAQVPNVVDNSAALIEQKELSGGSSTVYDTANTAFSHPSPTLTSDEKVKFLSGESFFDQSWVAAPSSTEARDGLGPYFNARSCAACHFKDGRGRPPEGDEPFESILLRLSVAGATDSGGPKGDANYGGQLQGFSLQDVTSEGDASVVYTEVAGAFDDGEPYTLAVPAYTISNLGYGEMTDIMISPRVAPAMIGMGLLQNISEADVLANADETDDDGDGISGRPNYVWDEVNQTTSLGRFGWKANQPSIEQQTAGAFLGDIGITTPLFPDQNIADGQVDATADVIHGGEPELSQELLDRVILYSKSLAVPARRDVDDEDVLLGEELFTTLDCAKCHIPDMQSGGETIHPYTDLLLHDMGEGLADNRPDFEATGSEWRTPPLWGIGLVETVNGHTRFLHDGRARNLEEAILWHGGEAEASKDAYKALSKAERDAVISFLESL